jgi:hypothetical protein
MRQLYIHGPEQRSEPPGFPTHKLKGPTMKYALVLMFATFLSAQASAAKPCEELKTEIAAKLEAAGVKGAVLEIVETDKVGDAKVVGSCEAGTKKITYAKT